METKTRKIDISEVRVGMIWYEDDTFSFKKRDGKKIKAIVELIDSDTIYGDISVSEIISVSELNLNWKGTKRYLENFYYPCKPHEEIVWYDIDQFKKIYQQYYFVKKTFKMLGKEYRRGFYWADLESPSCDDGAWCFNFRYGQPYMYRQYVMMPVRPVLALKVN